MPDQAKQAVKAALEQRGLNQSQLAIELGKERASISRTLSRSPIDPRSDWQAILDYLGLEIIVRPKN